LSQVIQNFDLMNIKDIETSMSLNKRFENSFNIIANDIINVLTLNIHNIDLQKIYNLLLYNQIIQIILSWRF
jgi:hypothetical protein